MMTPMEGTIVRIPAHVREPFAVYVNGVRQTEGVDFERRPGRLIFARTLTKEGKLGFWRWFLGAWGIGTYRKNDQVDLTWEVDGKPRVAHALDLEPAGVTSAGTRPR
jgi:hypothetical protein